MIRWALVAAALSGLAAVALGAFGSHALRAVLDADMQRVFATANRYHFLHTLALFAGALAPPAGVARRPLVVASALWLAGIVVFSGSLYLLAITGAGWLGALTPVGGLALLAGWAALVVAGWRSRAPSG